MSNTNTNTAATFSTTATASAQPCECCEDHGVRTAATQVSRSRNLGIPHYVCDDCAPHYPGAQPMR